MRNPATLRKSLNEKNQDAARSQRLLKMLPDAFHFNYGERRGDIIQLNFAPNPSFHPPTHEAEVFHAMEGSVWVNSKEARVEEITGHLIHEVKFGGGLLGHLNKGGTFDVKQAEVARGYWEMTLLKVQMKGKALFFKTIGVQQNYSRSDFRQVPDDLTLAQAADILRHFKLQSDLLPPRLVKLACAAIDNRPGRCQAGCRCRVAAFCEMSCLLNEVVLSRSTLA